MVSTVAQLAANTKMNLRHEDCWQVFLSTIKPQIEQIISSYFTDWQLIEQDVTAIMMKHMGLFTSRLIITSIDDHAKKVEGLRNTAKFKEVKRLSFSRKLNYLLEKDLVSKPIVDLLRNLARRRNKIHEYASVLSDDDRALFSYGFNLLHPTYIARCFDSEGEHMKYQIEQNDKIAIELLKKIRAQEASRFKGSIFADIDLDRVKGGWE